MNSYCKNRWGEEWNNDHSNPDLLDNKTFKDMDDSVQADQNLKIDNTLTLDQQMQHHLQEELSLQHLHIFNQLQVTNQFFNYGTTYCLKYKSLSLSNFRF